MTHYIYIHLKLVCRVIYQYDLVSTGMYMQDSLLISLEADLNSYRTLCSVSTTEGSRVQALQRSLSVHEVAIASLRGEYQRQSGELKLAEEEVSRLRKSLANMVRCM